MCQTTNHKISEFWSVRAWVCFTKIASGWGPRHREEFIEHWKAQDMPKKTQRWKEELEDLKKSHLILLRLTCFWHVSTYSNLPMFVNAWQNEWLAGSFGAFLYSSLEGEGTLKGRSLFQSCIAFPLSWCYFALNVKGKIDEINTVVHWQYCLRFASRICWWTSVKGQDLNSVPQASPLWHVEHV